MIELTLLLLTVAGMLTMLDWRKGLVMCAVVGVCADPLRKLALGVLERCEVVVHVRSAGGFTAHEADQRAARLAGEKRATLRSRDCDRGQHARAGCRGEKAAKQVSAPLGACAECFQLAKTGGDVGRIRRVA